MQTDFEVTRSGSLFLLEPITEDAEVWLNENIGASAQFWGRAVVVEYGYIQAIVQGIIEDGLGVV